MATTAAAPPAAALSQIASADPGLINDDLAPDAGRAAHLERVELRRPLDGHGPQRLRLQRARRHDRRRHVGVAGAVRRAGREPDPARPDGADRARRRPLRDPYAGLGAQHLRHVRCQHPALLRGFVAIGWFGVQSYLGATAVNALLGTAFSGWKDLDSVLGGVTLNLWIAMIAYWAVNFVVIRHGMETVRRFESWAGPMVFVVMVPALIWSIDKAGGLGPVFSESSKYDGTGNFLLHGFLPGVALFISASWATMVLNLPDLTRFARSNRRPGSRHRHRPAAGDRRLLPDGRDHRLGHAGGDRQNCCGTRPTCWSRSTSPPSRSSARC